jgi:hypothetical protein
MSNESFLPPPLMSAVRARDVARVCKAGAERLRELGDTATARYLERQSAWWMAYAVALAQISDTTFTVEYRDADGDYAERSFDTRENAEAFCDRITTADCRVIRIREGAK